MIIRDSGLVHSLLGLESLDDVLGHPVVGGSWEGFVIENLISSAPNGTQSFFLPVGRGSRNRPAA